jgi:hypothetical protein
MRFLINGTALASMALIGLVTCGKAGADDLRITIQRPAYTVWDWGVHPMVQQVPQPTSDAGLKAQADEVAKWEAFCQPVRHRDSLGAIRLTYRHDGCEFGRSE